MADDWSWLFATGCSAWLVDRSTNTWPLLMAWVSHSWVPQKNNPLANSPKDPSGCKTSKSLPLILLAKPRRTQHRCKILWFTGGHLWKLVPTSAVKIDSRTLNGSLSRSSGSQVSEFRCIELWLSFELQRPFSFTIYLTIICPSGLSFTYYLCKWGLAVFWNELTVR